MGLLQRLNGLKCNGVCMFKAFIIWLRGYILIKITGDYKDRFVNICSKNNIILWEMAKEKDFLTAYISKKDYTRCREYLEKTKVDLYILKKFGLPYFIKQYRRRYGFIIGFLLFFLLVYCFTMFVWDINVTGEGVYTKEQIIKDVRDNYVNIVTPKKDIDCEALEKELREKYDKVAWISCEIRGTRLNIDLTETINKNEIIKSENPCNIVAIKDGILTDIVVRTGKNTRQKGDEVKKGDIIITGTVNLYNDYDELLETNYVAADGDVYAIVEYNYSDEFDLYFYDKLYTGKEKYSFGIVIDDTYIPIGFKIDYDLYDQVIDEKRLKLGSSVYLPVTLNLITTKEYETAPYIYSKEEAILKAEKRLQVYIEELQKKGVEILENNVTINVSEDKCYAQGTIVAKELIGVPQELTIINQGEEPEE